MPRNPNKTVVTVSLPAKMAQQLDIDEAGRQAYLNAKAGKGLSPVFDAADDLIAHLHRATKKRRATARRSR
jgi:hypothetical protein